MSPALQLTPALVELRDGMHQAACDSFHAHERFGRDSAGHLAAMSAYLAAKGAYETACNAAGVEPYHYPSLFVD